jgi:hypothetical protein
VRQKLEAVHISVSREQWAVVSRSRAAPTEGCQLRAAQSRSSSGGGGFTTRTGQLA